MILAALQLMKDLFGAGAGLRITNFIYPPKTEGRRQDENVETGGRDILQEHAR